MPIDLSQIKDLLLPGLRGVTGKYDQIPSQYDRIYKEHTSEMALERTAEMRYVGLAQLKTEGGQTAFDNQAGQRFVYNQEHLEIALGYAMTRKAIDDNLYKTQFHPSNLGLMAAFQQTKEIYGANLINTATVLQPGIGGDGQPLWSFATRGKVDSSPVVAGSRVHVASLDGILYMLDVDKGTEVKQFKLDSPAFGSPAVGGNTLVISTLRGVTYCFAEK